MKNSISKLLFCFHLHVLAARTLNMEEPRVRVFLLSHLRTFFTLKFSSRPHPFYKLLTSFVGFVFYEKFYVILDLL